LHGFCWIHSPGFSVAIALPGHDLDFTFLHLHIRSGRSARALLASPGCLDAYLPLPDHHLVCAHLRLNVLVLHSFFRLHSGLSMDSPAPGFGLSGLLKDSPAPASACPTTGFTTLPYNALAARPSAAVTFAAAQRNAWQRAWTVTSLGGVDASHDDARHSITPHIFLRSDAPYRVKRMNRHANDRAATPSPPATTSPLQPGVLPGDRRCGRWRGRSVPLPAPRL